MKASLAWLSSLTGLALDATDAASRLTLAGLEVEGVHRYGDFAGVIAVEIRGVKPHPDAQKLRIVAVWDGESAVEVVCGAPEIPLPGSLVAWARPGSRLPGMPVVGEKAVRGINSPGMLCAEDELGLSENHDGLLLLDRVPNLAAGDDVARALALPDTIFDINVTPNRPDALGHVGLARELAALYEVDFVPPQTPALPTRSSADGNDLDVVAALDGDGSLRYCGALISGVAVAPSPTVLRLRLLSVGVRAISNLVDATNFIMLEWSQPLHAFDADKLVGAVRVRRAQDGEKLTTLDNVERALLTSDWVIADENRAIALAGVMGGRDTEVSATTTRILLECAQFEPKAIRKTARRLGLGSEASQRFERGVDVHHALVVAQHATAIIMQLAGGELAQPIVDRQTSAGLPSLRTINLNPARTNAILGVEVSTQDQITILRRLGLTVYDAMPNSLVETIPGHRPDLSREIDLIEEVARVRGYDSIPATLPAMATAPARPPASSVERVRDVMTAAGFDETINYAFGSPELFLAFGMTSGLHVANPLRTELSALRPSLVPGLVAAYRRNRLVGNTDVRLFEVGTTFLKDTDSETGARETQKLAILIAGTRAGWLKLDAADTVDAADLVGAIEELGRSFGQRIERLPSTTAWLHPGVRAELHAQAALGLAGELHPDLRRQLDIAEPVFVAEIDLQALGAPQLAPFVELPRFPSVSRDLSFFVDAHVSAKQLRDVIATVRPPLQLGERVLEDYRDVRFVPIGKKGMLWSFTYRAADRTLTDVEVDAAHQTFLTEFQKALQPIVLELR